MKPEEVVAVVRELNSEVDDVEDVSQSFYFEMLTDGNCSIVEWMGETLWSSEDDARDYIEEKDEYEPLTNYLRRERDKFLDDAIKHKTASNKQSTPIKCKCDDCEEPSEYHYCYECMDNHRG